ncbi:MAG: hypothetical protein EOP04_00045 [Proteobacteria bacterium]|nr:MAG: hypothetical protein EOP04_00045 [Pseudomonadota bacterium]
MKGTTMVVTMKTLGIMPSFLRTSVSDDNPFSEVLIKTMELLPTIPNRSFRVDRCRERTGLRFRHLAE